MGKGKGKGTGTGTSTGTGTNHTTSTTSATTTSTTSPRRCTPVVREAFGHTPFDAVCGSGQIITLVDATVNPMENVVAEIHHDGGGCPVVFTFNRVNAAPFTVTLQNSENFTVLVPGRVTSITASCPTGAGFCGGGVELTFTQCV